MTARSWQPAARSNSSIRTNRAAVSPRLAGARVAVTISLLFPLLAPCPEAGAAARVVPLSYSTNVLIPLYSGHPPCVAASHAGLLPDMVGNNPCAVSANAWNHKFISADARSLPPSQHRWIRIERVDWPRHAREENLNRTKLLVSLGIDEATRYHVHTNNHVEDPDHNDPWAISVQIWSKRRANLRKPAVS